MSKAIIRLKAVSKSYQRPGEGRLMVLNHIDFEVAKGEFVAIVGPSGSGKSTLMNILGLLDTADNGEYELAGKMVSGMSARELARTRNSTIGFVFQQFHLLSRTTAIENVELPLIYAKHEVSNARQMSVEALCRVGLEERLEHYPSELSGGQQQRVAIARALINQPDLILADEPTGNLDQEAGRQTMDLFRSLNQAGSTIVLITHDPQLARQANRVAHLDEGRLLAHSPELPAVNRLMHAAPSPHKEARQGVSQ
jgi:putative ABC transport system ATP-binding protein